MTVLAAADIFGFGASFGFGNGHSNTGTEKAHARANAVCMLAETWTPMSMGSVARISNQPLAETETPGAGLGKCGPVSVR
jgi:hypothetical protein